MHLYFARGSSGGHASSAHVSSSRTSSSSSRPTSSSRTTSTSSKPSITSQKTSTKPGTSIKTSSGRQIKSSQRKPTNSKYTHEKGIVGANGYTPRFNNYSAPAGSVVYYPQHSALDYLPWIYLFSQSSPRDDQATIVQPDNKQVSAQPQKGFDGLAVLNWILLIVILLAIVGGIIYAVNKFTKKGETRAAY